MKDGRAGELANGLARIGFSNASALAERLERYAHLLLTANRQTNLVGPQSIGELIPHLLDSLAPLAHERIASPIVDVGSGGGLPGLAAAIAFPGETFTLLEPRRKRADFLTRAIEDLDLRNVRALQLTAQTAADRGLGDTFGTALARAVAKPWIAIRLSLPLLRPGGRLILYCGRQRSPSRMELGVIGRGGAVLEEARAVEVPYLNAERHVWIVRRRARKRASDHE